jgi:hypothetical protein
MKRVAQIVPVCLMAVAIAAASNGCAGSNDVPVLKTVGPVPRTAKKTLPAAGHLVVYSAVELPPIPSDTLFYPHTAYAIYDCRGAFLCGVRNHIGPWDETPECVSLPPGRYTVSAESEFDGDVVVPIIIRKGRTTVVELQRVRHHAVVAWNGS